MKKSLLMIFVLLAVFAIPFVSAEASMSSELLSYEPIPAQPGQYVTVYLELKNIGDSDAKNAVIEIVDQFPFTVVGESSVEAGNLASQRSSVSDFKLKVDSQAVVGNNKLKVRFSPDGQTWQERTFNINVKSNDVSLSIVDVSTSPSEIVPGGDGVVSIKLKNTESVVIRNIGVQLGLVTISGSSIVDLPFIPTSSATEKKISRLNQDEVSEISFPIKAYPSATPGYYKLPLTITFYDDQGTKTETQDLIGVVVKSVPDLMVYLEKTDILAKDQSGDVTLKFVNKGINDLKFLDVTLKESSDYKIISTSKEYIGDLDSDDYRSETFKIIPSVESTNLDVSVTYKDENNKDFSQSISVPFEVSKDTSSKGKGPSFSTVLLIIVLIIVLVSWFRRKRKAKKHHK